MAIDIKSPTLAAPMLGLGLLVLFLGQRAFGHIDTFGTVLTVSGLALAIGAAAWQAFGYLSAGGDRRSVERTKLLCHAAILVGLLVYLSSTDTGMDLLGIADDGHAKYRTAATILFAIIVGIGAIPLAFVEGSQGLRQRRFAGNAANIDSFRVREMAWSGFTIALALAFLMVTCNVAGERDIRKDVSYFKTSDPGTAVINTITNGTSEQVSVLMFFPELNEVGDEVTAYFRQLDSETGGKLDIQRIDRLIRPKLAKELKVSKDGTVVLKIKDKSENIRLTTDIKRARRNELREFDGKVEKALLKLLRRKKIAYISIGHGELNDPDSSGTGFVNPGLKAEAAKQLIGALNYQVKNFDGLGKPIPDDADILVVLAPQRALIDEELTAIDDYLARGGSLLLSLDPEREASLGILEGRLGIHFNPTTIADEKDFMPQRRNRSDHRLILTNQFSSHASITSLSRGSARSGMLFFNSGSFDDAPFTNKATDGTNKATGGKPKRTYVIRSMTSAFRDLNKNFVFDKDGEKKNRYNLVAAIEDSDAKPAKPKEGLAPKGMRAIVAADGELFADAILLRVPKASSLLADSIKWLGGEEQFQGSVENEKDIKLEQSKTEEATSFWTTIVGVPLFIGLLGFVFRRRRKHS